MAHECPICHRHFGSDEALSQHHDSALPQVWQCIQCCNRTFCSIGALVRHRVSQEGSPQTPSRRYPCDRCNRSFRTQAGLDHHVMDVPGHRGHECIECDQDFDNAEALEQHLANAPAHIRNECIECDRVFGSMDALEQHLTNASAHRRHRAFNSAEALDQFLDSPNFNTHECIECDRVFDSANALEQHLTNALAHRSHRCNECHQIFNNTRDLQQHKNSTPNHTRVYENDRYTRPLSPPPAYAELGLAVESDTDNIDDVDDIDDLDADIAQFLVGFESMPVEDFWDPAEISDFSDEVFFGYFQARGFSPSFGAATPQSTTDNAADIGADPITNTDATHNRVADLVLDIESLTVTDPVPTNASSNEPVPTNGSANAPNSTDVLESKDASSVPSILEKLLKAEREKNKALEKELSSTQEALKKEKLYRQCGMCYERLTDTVTKCGHIFCGECVTSWQREHPQPFQTPCPMCRKPMGKTIRIFTE